MSLGHSPTIVSDGLLMHLDAANDKSFPTASTLWYNLLSTSSFFTLINGLYYFPDVVGVGTRKSIVFFRNVPPVAEDGGYATITTSGSLSALTYLHNNHTTEVWFKITNNQPTFYTVNENFSALVVYVGAGFSSGLYYDAQNFYYRIFGKGALNADVSDTFSFPYSDASVNVWNQIVARRSGNQLNIYLNGVLKTTGTITVLGTGIASTNVLNLAAANYGGDYTWHSVVFIAGLRMYNRGLTEAEILQNFNAWRGRYGI